MPGINATDIGQFMVAVGAIVEHPETGTILMVRRAEGYFKAGVWEVGYGRLDQGEDPETGLHREFREETGLKNLKIKQILTTWHFYRGEKKPENDLIGITFWVQSDSQTIKLSEEHDAFEWVSPQEAIERTSEDGIKRDITAFMAVKARSQAAADAQHKEQRAYADYQNLVRRTQEERAKLAKFASQQLIEDLLQPLEHLSMAADQLSDPGLDMVTSQLAQTLQQHGLEEIYPLGKPFDLETMEVVEQNGGDDIVSAVVKRGYKLHGKIIQHAKVVLGGK